MKTVLNTIAICITVALVVGCGPSYVTTTMEQKEVVFSIPPIIKTQELKAIAVLTPTTSRPSELQAVVQQEIKRRLPSVRMFDSRRISDLIMERGLKHTKDANQALGKLLNVDLFVAIDRMLSSDAYVRFIAQDGRIVGGITLPNLDLMKLEIVGSIIADVFVGKVEKRTFTVDFQFAQDDPDGATVQQSYRNGRMEDCKRILNKKMNAASTDLDRLYALSNLYNLYWATKDFNYAARTLDQMRNLINTSGNISIQVNRSNWQNVYNNENNEMNRVVRWAELSKRLSQSVLDATAGQKIKVAILPFEDGGTVTPQGIGVATYLTSELAGSDRFTLYERRHFNQLLLHEQTASNIALEGVDRIVTGIFLENTAVSRQPNYQEYMVSNRDGKGEHKETRLTSTTISYTLSFQGRITRKDGDVVSETFTEEVNQNYSGNGPSDFDVKNETLNHLANRMVDWVKINM